ncbi:hypothetical protein CMV_001288, partial [Castanea mollissima]
MSGGPERLRHVQTQEPLEKKECRIWTPWTL